MRFTSEQRLDDGITERAFTLGDIPGILWTPAVSPAPLILLGHPGGLHHMYPRLADRARQAAATGFAATLELPGSGDRLRIPDLEQARADLRSAVAAGEPVGDEIVDRQAALDLFDAFGSRDKTLNANMGGHTGVPPSAGDAAANFFVRHLT